MFGKQLLVDRTCKLQYVYIFSSFSGTRVVATDTLSAAARVAEVQLSKHKFSVGLFSVFGAIFFMSLKLNVLHVVQHFGLSR